MKTKILLLYKAYPFAIASYFRRALERRHDVELFTLGAFTGQSIPWNGNMTIPMKYPNQVDLPLPANMNSVAWNMVSSRLPWEPDLVLNIDAGFHFSTKPSVPYYVVGTDPHVLSPWYDKVRPIADKFFNMQGEPYIRDGDVWLPYAFDPTVHYPANREKRFLSFDEHGNDLWEIRKVVQSGSGAIEGKITPQIGDVVVIDRVGSHTSGHIAIYTSEVGIVTGKQIGRAHV